MKIYGKIFLFFILIGSCCSGCSYHPTPTEPSSPRFVTQVEILLQKESQTTRLQYTDPQKISTILNYIRLLKSYGNADSDPEQFTGDVCQIALQLSDNTRKTYHLRNNQYLSKDSHSWVRIDPEQGQKLYPILEQLESGAL